MNKSSKREEKKNLCSGKKKESLYTFSDLRGSPGRYLVFSLEEISFFYDRRELFLYLFPLLSAQSFSWLSRGQLAEGAILEKEGYSLLRPSTYKKFSITPPLFLVQKSLLTLRKEKILQKWWPWALQERNFFQFYLSELALSSHWSLLNFWLKKSQEKNFSLPLYFLAERYYNDDLTYWFFKYGLASRDYAYCRLAWLQSREKESLLKRIKEIWSKTTFLLPPLSTWPPQYIESSPFLTNLKVEQLNYLWDYSLSFQPRAEYLDQASARADSEVLNFWLKKALLYGSNFLCYNEALDLAAYFGHRKILDWWSMASKSLSLPLYYSENLPQRALAQKRLDILYWWRETGWGHYRAIWVYEAAKKADLELLNFFAILPLSFRRSLFPLLERMAGEQEEGKFAQWWQREGEEKYKNDSNFLPKENG